MHKVPPLVQVVAAQGRLVGHMWGKQAEAPKVRAARELQTILWPLPVESPQAVAAHQQTQATEPDRSQVGAVEMALHRAKRAVVEAQRFASTTALLRMCLQGTAAMERTAT
jgi:hypothetical protein